MYLSIQPDSLARTTLNSSNVHTKQTSQLRSWIASAPSDPVAPEIFDTTHATSYSVKLRGKILGTSSYYSKAAHVVFSTGSTCISGCLSKRTSVICRSVLVHRSSGRIHPTPSMSVYWWTTCQIFPDSTVLWNVFNKASSSYPPPLLSLPSCESHSSSVYPARPVWRNLSQRSILIVILDPISLDLWTPNVLLSVTWEKNRGLSEFHLQFRTSLPSAARISVNQHHTIPAGVAYQMAYCAAIRLHWRCHKALYRTPIYRWEPSFWWEKSPYIGGSLRYGKIWKM